MGASARVDQVRVVIGKLGGGTYSTGTWSITIILPDGNVFGATVIMI